MRKEIMTNSLTHLDFGYCINQLIEKDVLPVTRKELRFDVEYIQPIGKGDFPNLLKDLVFGDNFNQVIEKGVLPKSLIKLKFGKYFN